MLKIEEMTVEQKIGHIHCGCLVYDLPGNLDYVLDLIKKRACTCLRVSLNRRGAEYIKRVREVADYPLLIITDMETGYKLSGRPTVPLISLAACNNSEYNKAFAAVTARDAKAAGYTGCWGPVVDILEGDGPASVSRKSGDSPKSVTKFARDIAEVFATYNFQSTGKHYPGGKYDFPLDSHMVEGVCSKTEDELLKFDLVPYFELWKENLLPSVMTRHCVYPNIDPDYPASLSKKVIDIIRSRGYDGVIYTDSLAMMGILQKYGEENAMALAFEAGNDIIMPNCRRPAKETYEMLLNAYKEGRISDERLDEAVSRILKLAETLDKEPENPYPVPKNIDEILTAVARDCITAMCDDGVEASIPVDSKKLFVVTTDQGFDGVASEISSGQWYSAKKVINAIKERFPESEIVTIEEYPSAYNNETVLNTATKYDDVVFVSFCTSGAYLGTDCLTRRLESVMNALAISGKLSTVVHFGNPLALKNIKHIKRKIFGYTASESQIYAFDVLAGRIPAKGSMPYSTVLEREYANNAARF